MIKFKVFCWFFSFQESGPQALAEQVNSMGNSKEDRGEKTKKLYSQILLQKFK